MDGSRSIGCAEIGWSELDVWVTDDDTLKRDNIIFWDLTADSLSAVVAQLISRLESTEENNS